MSESKPDIADERAFFASGTDVESVIAMAHRICLTGGRVYGAVLTISTDLAQHLRRLTEGYGRLRGFKVSGTSPYLIELPHHHENAHTTKARAFMWQVSDSDLCFFLTCQEREEFDFAFDAVHTYLQPELCRIFLRSAQIEHTLREVAKNNPQSKIRVHQYVARKWREGRTSAGKVDTTVEYCDEDYAAVFDKIGSEGKWLSSLQLAAEGRTECAGRISRDCAFSCTANFRFFFDTFVGNLARQILSQRTLFRDRGRTTSPTHASRPLKIVYKTGVFADKKNNYRLINVLEGCPNSALAVFHPNPYLHATFIDYADGSSYSILVSTSTGIMIMPERKATTQSLARLCEYICDNFEEGDVVEFTPHDG